MKTKTVNKIAIYFVIWISILSILFTTNSCTTTKGYDYNKHHKKNVHYKHNNEHGKYMKCNRH
jgi:hypothetical protein